MKLTLTEFVSLDGVSQGPGSPEEDTTGGFTLGGWFVPHMDQDFIDLAAEWLGRADGLLLGRRTYEAFARDWPQITDADDPFTVRMNALPKYVATNSLEQGSWNPTTVLSGDIAAQVQELKKQPGRELQIHGSARLAGSLLAAGLIDELRLVVAPVVLGRGRRLFPDGGAPAGLRLMETKTTPGGLTILLFAYTGNPDYSTYTGAGDIT
ncbi:dihydrofolate reductase family protein [Paeniglutamicibacter gangotriensis]|uniref:Riboflavin biosynthesis protein RibD C-domain-containing protein n=1 Tax=Paeniglutamicibacter gangotriensis Lz1y TaxID=1276920 RepID=M7NNP6_9MICC|nr:dihydrofolate reductase family protein [Paeniglutamicibacter gangotriensis]EMR00169.1 riboflavin biosynthesis protein RibD C- domain-containing protein [Paeniglutamicibacter gangotriensis Lz1y]